MTDGRILGLNERLPQFFNCPNFHPLNKDQLNLKQRVLQGDVRHNLEQYPYIHKLCYEQYNAVKLQRLKEQRKRLASDDDNDKSAEEADPTSESRPKRNKAIASKCMFCDEGDKYTPRKPSSIKWRLRAAGSHQLSKQHALNFNSELKKIATFMNDTKISTLLEGSDVRAGELYYHLPCYTEYKNAYTRSVTKMLYFYLFIRIVKKLLKIFI